jgi:hypothetical protein
MRRWIWPAAVAGLVIWPVLSWSLSEGIGHMFAYYDPQSDDERLEERGDLAVHIYTAGHWLGQLVSALAGAHLVQRSGRLVVARAVLAGTVLAALTGSAALAVGSIHVRSLPSAGLAADPTMLSDPDLRWCLAASLLGFPLWALLGASLAAVVGDRLPVEQVVGVAFLWQPIAAVAGMQLSHLLFVAVAAPPSSHPVAITVMSEAGRSALLFDADLLAWTLVATAVAVVVARRRARRRAGQFAVSLPG